MRRTQRAATTDEAVSPIVGVILMVAITVVLAATLFLVTSRLKEGANAESPYIGFSTHDNAGAPGGTLTIVRITNGPVEKADVVVDGTAGPTCSWNYLDPTSLTINAGDELDCTGNGRVTISHAPSDTLFFQAVFE